MTHVARTRLAELTSGLGAVVLGIGLGVRLADHLIGFSLAILATGLVVHAWGMYDKHRLKRQAGTPNAWWETVAYWTCWVLLGAFAFGIAGRLSGVV